MRLCTIWFNKSYLNLRYTVKVFAAIFVSKALRQKHSGFKCSQKRNLVFALCSGKFIVKVLFEMSKSGSYEAQFVFTGLFLMS